MLRNLIQPWFWPVLFAWLSLFALGLIDNARGPVFPDILREFGLSDTAGSFFFLTASVASLVHNTLFFRFLSLTSPQRLVGIYTLIMGAGAILISHATDYRWTLVACAVLGVGFGGLGVGQNAAVQEAPPEHRQRAMGLLHTMYGISSFSAPLFVSYLAIHGWRFALVILSMPSMFVGLVVVFEGLRAAKMERTASAKNRVRTHVVAKSGNLSSNAGFATVTMKRATWFAASLVALLVVGEISVSSRLALLARREWGVGVESAGTWVAAYFAAMTASRLFLGLFKFSFSARELLGFSILLGFPFLLLGFMPLGFSTGTRLVFLVGFGFPIAMGYPLAMTRLAEIFGDQKQKVTSLCLITQSGAAMFMHFTLGWGADTSGLLFVLGTVAITALLGAFASFWFLERAVSKA
ncbi:hypothetical protein BH10BDE1_BH10BDE1_02890 [soil metagenome]